MADATLAHVPADVSDEEALLLGDIFSTGFFAADNAGIGALVASARSAGSGAAGGAAGDGQQQGGEADGGEAGPVVAVVGCGPVGVLACIGGCLGPALTRSLHGLLRATKEPLAFQASPRPSSSPPTCHFAANCLQAPGSWAQRASLRWIPCLSDWHWLPALAPNR